MAGVKGRSGGRRAGAGRKPGPVPVMGDLKGTEVAVAPEPAPPEEPAPEVLPNTLEDAKAFLIRVMQDNKTDPRLRMDAAKALLPFQHVKLGDSGKKEQRQQAAKAVASRFASAAPPRLAAAGGRKV